MALPFFLPRDEATEEQYRRLEQLLRDLYAVLRALITGGANPLPPWPIFQHPPPPPPPPPQGPYPPANPNVQLVRRMAAMNLSSISETSTPDGSSSSNQTPPAMTSKLPHWPDMGRELRDITDHFQTTARSQHVGSVVPA